MFHLVSLAEYKQSVPSIRAQKGSPQEALTALGSPSVSESFLLIDMGGLPN